MAFDRFDLADFEAARGAERARLAGALDAICRETGFLTLTGHGVPDAVVEGVTAAARAFFDLPMGEKLETAPEPGNPYGYLAPEAEALAASKGDVTPPDLKESFNGGPPEARALAITDPEALAFCYLPTPWPDLPGFREAWIAYYAAMEALAVRVMAAFAEALGLEPGFFAPFIDAPVSALRALNYPESREAPREGQQRAGAHSDYGSLTILLPEPGSSGLQIQTPGGGWREVPAEPGCFVVNIGDLMARWTADRWVSTLHRVVAKPGQPRRQSLAFFHQPNWSAEIVSLDGSDTYAPVLSGPYLMEKFRATERV